MELEDLRAQVIDRGDLRGVIHRPLAGALVEVAMWDLETMVERGDVTLDDETVLARARTQAIADAAPSLHFEPVDVADTTAEVVISEQPYVGACLVDLLARAQGTYVVAPISWRHWILHAIGDATTDATLAAIVELAQRLRSRARPAERLGAQLYHWPGNGQPSLLG